MMPRHAIALGLGLTLALAAPARAQDHAAHGNAAHDTSFARLQERGRVAMGVDQYTSRHRFEVLADGGRIELQRIEEDSAGTDTIRRHLREIAAAFKAGDFSTPGFVHWKEVPGVPVMTERRGAISYGYRDLPRGGELRITSKDSLAVKAIHEFLAFQNSDHRTGH
jgi:hypothetical protein